MKRVDLVKKGKQWVAEGSGKAVSRGPIKAEAIKRTARAAKREAEPVSVKIHKTDGSIQEERTYLRKADPRRSKGWQNTRDNSRGLAPPSVRAPGPLAA
jgi:hypothetical protein